MARRKINLKGFKLKSGGVSADLNVSRFNRQYAEAQYELDNQVMTDMVPYMPFLSGTFVDLTRAESAALAGSGMVVAAVPPSGRFLYYGKLMIYPETGSAWAPLGGKKVVTDTPLNYTKTFHPNVQAEWFDAAKADHIKAWIDIVKEKAGGG